MAARPRIGLVFEQFGAYHVDRCQAVAERLGGRYEVIAVEIASTSTTYAWEPAGEVAGARKLTLFPGTPAEEIGTARKAWALRRALRGCRWAFCGVPSSDRAVIALSWLLPLLGTRTVMLTESKFDDFPRRIGFEAVKALLYRPYRGAIVGGRRQADYLRFLGFGRRPVLPGYDTVGLDRVRRLSGQPPAPDGKPFAERGFLFVGRFVEKKNLLVLIDAYARYRELAGAQARPLVLAGSGELQPRIEERVHRNGLEDAVRFAGFLDAGGVARALADALALVLPSTEEQWGLVVNEAIACGLPAIVSEAVGSRDALVRDFENGFVCRAEHVEGFARAMLEVAADETRWRAMCNRSQDLNWFGDTARFADAVETMIEGADSPSNADVQRFARALGID